ncbi:hypothetical protein FNF29_02410 [Cafeteria roenbergensis]|uniref:Uncharacterized protein n=1 Tax=Cafeteria roenbergensis TaxID=33653 RepID=A0A5A8CN43_CAFRO|nr:hypothetical protein FNF29_02410 [Cafeteria roenbergensis]|eukprot:KAA0154533.1 hypothetical protein FNF29_02410 [Cafeteria roenbergensis]
MDGADNALAPLFRQAQEEYDRVVGENRELREANHRLQQSVRSLSDELRMSKARFESDSQAAAEAREALRAQNASLLKKHQAVAEQAARLQLQLAQLTRLDNERILRGSGNDGAESRTLLLSRTDLEQLMAVLSDFNDGVIAQEEAVRRAGITLEAYGPIREEFASFLRLAGAP